MRTRWAIFPIVWGVFVLGVCPVVGAVDTAAIDAVRSKDVLGGEDFETIDAFVGSAVADMVRTRDLSEITEIRVEIEKRTDSEKASASRQYKPKFYEAAVKHIGNAFVVAFKLPEIERFLVTTNLLVLVDRLDNVKVAELAVSSLDSDSAAIRYLAVGCFANSNTMQELSKPENAGLASRVADKLLAAATESDPDTVGAMADFASGVKHPKATDLLAKIADGRISKYAKWSVEDYMIDNGLLKALCRKILSDRSAAGQVGPRFGQLCSFAIQRYIMDIDGRELLTEAERKDIRSVLLEVEHSCIGELLGRPQSLIKMAVEREDPQMLANEGNRLFGDGTQPGAIPTKFNFDYGAGGSGGRLLGPVVLQPRPKEAQAKGDAGSLFSEN
jgi:hypothetical protein